MDHEQTEGSVSREGERGRRGPGRRERLLLLFAVGVLAFNYPLLSLVSRDVTVGGVPLLYAALFALWGALIGATAWIMRGERDG